MLLPDLGPARPLRPAWGACVPAQVLPGVTACVTFTFLSLGFLIREKEMSVS